MILLHRKIFPLVLNILQLLKSGHLVSVFMQVCLVACSGSIIQEGQGFKKRPKGHDIEIPTLTLNSHIAVIFIMAPAGYKEGTRGRYFYLFCELNKSVEAKVNLLRTFHFSDRF